MSIKKKMVLLISVLVATVAISTGLVSLLQSSEAMREQVEELIPRTASDSAGLVRAVLDIKISQIERVSSFREIKDMDWKLQQPVLDSMVTDLDFFQIGIAKNDGTLMLNDGSVSNVKDRQYFAEAMSGAPVVSDLFMHKILNVPVMVIAVPIMGPDQNIDGLVVGILDATWLSEITQNMGYGENGYSYIIDSTGTLIAHDTREFVVEQRNFLEEGKTDPLYASLSNMFQKMVNGESGYDEYLFMGVDRFFGYAPIPDTTWSLAVGAYKDDVFFRLYEMQKYI